MGIFKRQGRLREIGLTLREDKPLSGADREFLAHALINIADGTDPKEALDIKPRRGERSSTKSENQNFRRQLAIGWISILTSPVAESGQGLSVDAALEQLDEFSEHPFGFTSETLRSYWYKRHTDTIDVDVAKHFDIVKKILGDYPEGLK